MEADPIVARTLRWYLGRGEVEQDAAHIAVGDHLALIGGVWDDLPGFAARLDAGSSVLDLRGRTPSAREVNAICAECPRVMVLAHRAERVVIALGLIMQPWYIAVSPLTARPREALPLLREEIAELGVTRPLDDLGPGVIKGLEAYGWPRGLQELREVAKRLAAVLDEGTLAGAGRRLSVSRQAVTKFLGRRLA